MIRRVPPGATGQLRGAAERGKVEREASQEGP